GVSNWAEVSGVWLSVQGSSGDERASPAIRRDFQKLYFASWARHGSELWIDYRIVGQVRQQDRFGRRRGWRYEIRRCGRQFDRVDGVFEGKGERNTARVRAQCIHFGGGHKNRHRQAA